jgi:hypothetical protein
VPRFSFIGNPIEENMYQEDGALIEFFQDAIQNNKKTKDEGRPVFDDKDFIRIQTPGDTHTVIVRIATEQDKKRFPKCWNAYQQGQQMSQEGTPLEQWNLISRSQTLELKHKGIATVETLVQVSDTNLQKMGPGYIQLRNSARQYLESSADLAKATQAARERDEAIEKMALMQEQIDALTQQLAAAPKRGPGRPPNSEREAA